MPSFKMGLHFTEQTRKKVISLQHFIKYLEGGILSYILEGREEGELGSPPPWQPARGKQQLQADSSMVCPSETSHWKRIYQSS